GVRLPSLLRPFGRRSAREPIEDGRNLFVACKRLIIRQSTLDLGGLLRRKGWIGLSLPAHRPLSLPSFHCILPPSDLALARRSPKWRGFQSHTASALRALRSD